MQFPVESGPRHMRDTVEYLRKNGSNYKKAIVEKQNARKKRPPRLWDRLDRPILWDGLDPPRQ
jgi:hypothetical protein